MSEKPPIINRVKSTSLGIPGRSLNTARTVHFIVDSPKIGEALTSGEAFLSGISSCGVNLVETHALDSGTPLKRIEVEIEGVRDAARPMDFQAINLHFQLTGVSQAQAEKLVGVYQAN